MNEAHWHLVVNHAPIIFPVAGLIIMLAGLASKSEHVKRTAYMIFVIGSLSAILGMTTGEGAEHIAEKISGISEDYIEAHEEAAETFATMSYILGALSLLGLWASFKQKSFANTIGIISLAFALVVMYFGQQAGTSGGEIRHTEIRNENSTPPIEHEDSMGDDD